MSIYGISSAQHARKHKSINHKEKHTQTSALSISCPCKTSDTHIGACSWASRARASQTPGGAKSADPRLVEINISDIPSQTLAALARIAECRQNPSNNVQRAHGPLPDRGTQPQTMHNESTVQTIRRLEEGLRSPSVLAQHTHTHQQRI